MIIKAVITKTNRNSNTYTVCGSLSQAEKLVSAAIKKGYRKSKIIIGNKV